jgi:hypothetical protein
MLCPSDSFSIFNILPTIQYTLAQKQVWSNYGSAHLVCATPTSVEASALGTAGVDLSIGSLFATGLADLNRINIFVCMASAIPK